MPDSKFLKIISDIFEIKIQATEIQIFELIELLLSCWYLCWGVVTKYEYGTSGATCVTFDLNCTNSSVRLSYLCKIIVNRIFLEIHSFVPWFNGSFLVTIPVTCTNT